MSTRSSNPLYHHHHQPAHLISRGTTPPWRLIHIIVTLTWMLCLRKQHINPYVVFMLLFNIFALDLKLGPDCLHFQTHRTACEVELINESPLALWQVRTVGTEWQGIPISPDREEVTLPVGGACPPTPSLLFLYLHQIVFLQGHFPQSTLVVHNIQLC